MCDKILLSLQSVWNRPLEEKKRLKNVVTSDKFETAVQDSGQRYPRRNTPTTQ